MAPSWPVPQRLAVGRGHRMAWRGVGDPGGEPWLLLHGGPGSGAQPGLLAPLDLGRQQAIVPVAAFAAAVRAGLERLDAWLAAAPLARPAPTA